MLTVTNSDLAIGDLDQRSLGMNLWISGYKGYVVAILNMRHARLCILL